MRFKEIFESDECKELFEDVNKFTSKMLEKYNKQIEDDFHEKEDAEAFCRGKDVFDFVWGTVELSPVEIFLLDSPLLQRLRNIKQLGFGHTVYCNADYSRFAHTIGVVEASGRMANVVLRELKSKRAEEENKKHYIDMREVVRLAAVLHDCGHLFYSHVSESFFSKNERNTRYKQINTALTFFDEKISHRAAFHEMLSAMIVNSDEIRHLFKIVRDSFESKFRPGDKDIDLLIDYITGLIVGTAVDKKILPYSMIIKGAVDSDRMDYLARDSCTTKVPLAVDIGRLINKLTVVNLSEYKQPDVWNDNTSEKEPYFGMAIRYSAQRLIWQLSMARAIMYQSVYFHHKKLTAEAMFKRACERAFSLMPSTQFDEIMMLTDQEFGSAFTKVMVPEKNQRKKEYAEAQELLERIRNRNLYKRVACFSQDVVKCKHESDYDIFVSDVIENQFSEEFDNFIKELTEEYNIVLEKREKTRLSEPPVFMFIEANWQSESSGDIPIDFGNAPYKMSTKVFTEAPTWGEENKQKQYYLVTDQRDRDLVYIALERVLSSEKYGITISEGAATCAKFSVEQIATIKGKLLDKGYYDDALRLLPDRVLDKVYDKRLFEQILRKFQTFNGVNNAVVDENSLKRFLRQFLYTECSKDELKSLLDGVLRLLSNATYLNREMVSKSLATLMDKIRETEKCNNNIVVKLGGFFDSSNRYSYYFNDVPNKKEFNFVESVPTALRESQEFGGDSCIVFFDDGAYSGKQVVSIFQELMGVPVEKRETDEHHVEPLDDECKEIIKSARIVLAYVCFNPDREAWIKEMLNGLGIKNVCIVYKRSLDKKIFSDEDSVFPNAEQRQLVEEKLREIGYQVQKSSKTNEDNSIKPRWDEERFKTSSLGYNDAQQMVVFEANVPTYTITPFWQNGRYEGEEWRGLFQRTEK